MAGSYKIADGYIEIHGRRDRAQIQREARESGGEAGEIAGREMARAADESAEREGARRSRRGGLLRALFTPNPGIMAALTRPLGAIFSTPAAAIGLLFGLTFLASAAATIIAGGLPFALVAAFAGLGALLLSEDEKIVARFEKMKEKIVGSLKRAAAPLQSTFMDAMGTIERAVLKMEPVLKRIFTAIDPAVGSILVGVLGGIEAFLIEIEPHIPALVEMAQAFAAELPGAFIALADFFGILAEHKDMIITVLPAAFNVLAFVIKAVAVVLLYLVSVFGGFVIIKDFMVRLFGTDIPNVWKRFTAWLSGAWATFRGWLSSTWRSIWQPVANFVGSIWESIVSRVRGSTATVGSIIQTMQSIPGRVRAFFEGARAAIVDRWNAAVSWVRGVPGRIMSALGNLGGLLRGAGRAVVQGLINGIMSMFGALAGAAGKLAGVIARNLPGSPVKDGPLRVLNDGYAGRQIVSMIGDGMTSERGRLSNAIGNTLSVLTAPASPAPVAASGGNHTYVLQLGTRELARFVVDAVTGQPGPVALAIKDFERGRAQ